jgi:hypothetical protein
MIETRRLPMRFRRDHGFNAARGALWRGWALGLSLICGHALATDMAGAKDHPDG